MLGHDDTFRARAERRRRNCSRIRSATE